MHYANNKMNAAYVTMYRGRSIHIILIALYFLIAPLEDLLSTSIGTISKYLALAIVVLAFIDMVRNNAIRKIHSYQFITILLIILAWISSYWSIDISASINRNIAYTLLPSLFLLLSLSSYLETDISLIENAIIIGGLITSIFVIINHGWAGLMSGRLTLTENNDPNNLSAFLFLPLTMASYKFIETDSNKNRIRYFVGILFIATMFLLTGSRGGLISFIIFLLLYIPKASKFGRQNYIIKISIIIVAVYLIFPNVIPQEILDRYFVFDNYQYELINVGTRSDIWKTIIFYIIPHMPALGYGAGSAPIVLSSFYGFAKGVHNTYLNMLLEFGYLGLPLFMLLLSSLGKKLKIGKAPFNFALFIGMLTLIFFLDSYAKKYFWNVMIYIMIASNNSSQKEISI